MHIVVANQPTAALERMTRAQIERAAVERATGACINSVVCIQTQAKEQTHPWVLGKVLATSAPAAILLENPTQSSVLESA